MAAVVVLGAGVLAGAWWLIGDLSKDPFDDEDRLDYLIKIDLDPALEAAAGVAGILCALTAALWLLTSYGRRDGKPCIRVVVAVATAGALSAGGLRIMSAGVYGANIGGGMFMMFGIPVVIALLAYAAVNVHRVRSHERGSLSDTGAR